MTKELCFITVLGEDQKGIIAKVSSLLYEKGINIEDVSQKIIDGYFVMSMMADVSDAKVAMEELRKTLEGLGEKMSLKIQVQHEDIFKAMHRV
jgi:ACT domain-containing protein